MGQHIVLVSSKPSPLLLSGQAISNYLYNINDYSLVSSSYYCAKQKKKPKVRGPHVYINSLCVV